MWALPNIAALNRDAASPEGQARIAAELSGEIDMECELCGKEPVVRKPYFDVFSTMPKGVVALCEKHEDNDEGYFECDGCDRLFILNYTWEMYRVFDPATGETHCINCAREKYLADDANWYDAKLRVINFDVIRKAPHLFAVGQTPEEYGLKLVGNVEFDAYTGERLYGTQEQGVAEVTDLINKAVKDHGRCVLILDAAYQFAISLGVYVELAPDRDKASDAAMDAYEEVLDG